MQLMSVGSTLHTQLSPARQPATVISSNCWPSTSPSQCVSRQHPESPVFQNAAARLLTGTRRGDHISPVLRQLHWLPVQRRVSFNWRVSSSRHRLARHLRTWLTTYIWSRKDLDVSSARLPTDHVLFYAHTTHSVTGFAVAGPRVWNSLPANLRDEDNLSQSWPFTSGYKHQTYTIMKSSFFCNFQNVLRQIERISK